MKLLQNVLIKVIRGGFTDRVIYVDNLPEDLIYESKHPMKIEGQGPNQHWVPDFEQPKVMVLREHIYRSQTGDDGVVFDLDNIQSTNHYLAVKKYVDSVNGNARTPFDPVVNSVEPSRPAAPALSLDKIPRVVLPVLSPAGVPSPVTGGTTDSSATTLDVDSIKRQAVAEYKAEQSEKMAKARASRKAPVGKNSR